MILQLTVWRTRISNTCKIVDLVLTKVWRPTDILEFADKKIVCTSWPRPYFYCCRTSNRVVHDPDDLHDNHSFPVGLLHNSGTHERTLEEELWFHGVLPREEVVRLLQHDGDFLVRETTRYCCQPLYKDFVLK